MPPNQPEPWSPSRVAPNPSSPNESLQFSQRAVNISPSTSAIEHYFYAYKPQASKKLISSSTSTNTGFVETFRFAIDDSFAEPYDDIEPQMPSNATQNIDNSTFLTSSIYVNE